ncbi:MAG: HDOD domain-containing protein [Planctomycetota bacterium]
MGRLSDMFTGRRDSASPGGDLPEDAPSTAASEAPVRNVAAGDTAETFRAGAPKDDIDALEAAPLPPLHGREAAFVEALRQRVFQGRLTVPVLPPGMLETLRAIDDSHASTEAIETAIRLNPAIGQEIVRTANSVWFGGRAVVDDVRLAILRLGIRNLRHVLLGVSLKLSLACGGRLGELTQEIWEHSVACSSISGHLATYFGADRDLLFLAGLLHDLGKVSVLATMGDVLSRDLHPSRPLLPALLHRFHTRAGAVAAQRWHLSSEIVASAAHHHRPPEAGPHQRIVAMVNLANRICHTITDPLPRSSHLLAACAGGRLLEIDSAAAERLLSESEAALARHPA